MKTILFAALALAGTGVAYAQADDPLDIHGHNPDGQACTPPGFNVGLSVYPQCEAVPRPAHGGDYPPCTPEITDHCVQTYAREENR